MRIAILTIDHLYSNKLLKDLINEFGDDIKIIAEPESQLKGKSDFYIVKKYIKTSGIYYTFAQIVRLSIYKVLSLVFGILGFKKNKFYPYKRLAQNKGITTLVVGDVNSKGFIKKIKSLKVDVVISVLFSQILKKDLIKTPKKGVINIHPAFLPNYKGISPIFWSLVNKEKSLGVTVHFIDEGIDTGGIISRKRIKIEKDDTEDSLYWKCVCEGSEILIKAIYDINKRRIKTVKNSKGSYFSFPTKEMVKKFKKQGRSFFRIREYLFVI